MASASATLLESLCIPRTSLPSPISASYNHHHHRPRSLPPPLQQFRGGVGIGSVGLGLRSRSKTVSRGATGRIACERTPPPGTAPPAVDLPSVNESTWQSLVLESDVPVLVEFWAPWCGPCRMIIPVIDELAKQYAGKLKCFKVNTDESPSIATKYGIRSIPTVMIFKNGEKKDAVIGAVPKSTLTNSIEKFL